jgi:hypothetical protein
MPIRESSMSEWKPIETAPKDGTPILLCRVGMNYWPRTFAWNGEFWGSPSGMFWDEHPARGPSHWQPRPTPPSERRDDFRCTGECNFAACNCCPTGRKAAPKEAKAA